MGFLHCPNLHELLLGIGLLFGALDLATCKQPSPFIQAGLCPAIPTSPMPRPPSRLALRAPRPRNTLTAGTTQQIGILDYRHTSITSSLDSARSSEPSTSQHANSWHYASIADVAPQSPHLHNLFLALDSLVGAFDLAKCKQLAKCKNAGFCIASCTPP